MPGVTEVRRGFGRLVAPRRVAAAAFAVALAVGLLLALAPGAGAETLPSRFPAAGELLWPTVAVRKEPRPSARRIMTLHELRRDLRPQIVHAIGMRKIGVVQEAKARAVLANLNGANALELVARDAGAQGNTIRVSVTDAGLADDGTTNLDTFVVTMGGPEVFRLRYPDADLATLAGTLNSSVAPVTARVVLGSDPLNPVTGVALKGGVTGNPGKVWYKLNLPIRPFGQKGWIPAEAALVKPTTRRVVVRRGAKVLDVYRGSRRIFRTRVAVGRPDRKTPLGNFYVAAKYVPPRNSLVSAYALELSAPAGLPDFLQGGVVGIHGTPALWSLGKAASNGCIRVSPSAALRLKRLVPLGSPVKVVR